jgi:alginate O-acetyltransferase complex protein AlgI
MVFSSYLFLFYFLPAALLLYYVMPRRGRHLALTALSYAFYGWANPLFIILLLVSTLVDYACGLAIAQGGRLSSLTPPAEPLQAGGPRNRAQRTAVAISIVTNLSLLGFFKYFNFAAENFDALVAWLGMPRLEISTVVRVTLPLGISFYTFQSMSYTLDVYRGQARALANIIDFACYVSMFPQLVAGPIIRFSEVAEQLRDRQHTVAKVARGVAFLSLGLAKKVLLANPCGKIADVAFDAATVTTLDAWYGVTAYAFQIYFDFSGYSDMAIGLGLMLGFVFPKNFDSPYHSRSITEFWRRWHISLSSWLRDYLYIPLGGSRLGPARTYGNLAVVMLLGGLWHGAAWNFVAWGGLHGALLASERLRGKGPLYRRWPGGLQTATTFVIVLFTWVFFRAADLPAALRFAGRMLGVGAPMPAAQLIDGIVYQPYYVLTFALAGIVTWGAPQTWDWTRSLPPWKAVAAAALFIASAVALTTQAYNPFIYFIF